MCNWTQPTEYACGCRVGPRFLGYCPEQVIMLIHRGHATRCPPTRPWLFTILKCARHDEQMREERQVNAPKARPDNEKDSRNEDKEHKMNNEAGEGDNCLE